MDTRQDSGPWRCSSEETGDETCLIAHHYVVHHHVFTARHNARLASAVLAMAFPLVLLRWREFEARSVAVFLLTCHRGGGGGGRCQSQGC